MQETLQKLTEFYLKHKDKVQKAERAQEKPKKAPTTLHVQDKRAIPASVLHKVYLRDRGKCQFKDCQETRYVQIHHRTLFAKGGKHELSNLITLCSAHHRLLHNTQTPQSHSKHNRNNPERRNHA